MANETQIIFYNDEITETVILTPKFIDNNNVFSNMFIECSDNEKIRYENPTAIKIAINILTLILSDTKLNVDEIYKFCGVDLQNYFAVFDALSFCGADVWLPDFIFNNLSKIKILHLVLETTKIFQFINLDEIIFSQSLDKLIAEFKRQYLVIFEGDKYNIIDLKTGKCVKSEKITDDVVFAKIKPIAKRSFFDKFIFIYDGFAKILNVRNNTIITRKVKSRSINYDTRYVCFSKGENIVFDSKLNKFIDCDVHDKIKHKKLQYSGYHYEMNKIVKTKDGVWFVGERGVPSFLSNSNCYSDYDTDNPVEENTFTKVYSIQHSVIFVKRIGIKSSNCSVKFTRFVFDDDRNIQKCENLRLYKITSFECSTIGNNLVIEIYDKNYDKNAVKIYKDNLNNLVLDMINVLVLAMHSDFIVLKNLITCEIEVYELKNESRLIYKQNVSGEFRYSYFLQ